MDYSDIFDTASYAELRILLQLAGEHQPGEDFEENSEFERLTAQEFWDTHTSTALHTLLGFSGYSDKRIARHYSWYQKVIVPQLGPGPTRPLPFFDSFINDDFSPVEFSWSHGCDRSLVGVAIEPISIGAGTPQDPFNQSATVALLQNMDIESNDRIIDLEVFRRFRNHLAIDTNRVKTVADLVKAAGEPSTMMTVSFDLGRTSTPIPKVHFYPIAKSLDTRKPCDELIYDEPGRYRNQLEVLREFIADCKRTDKSFQLERVSLDCVHPGASDMTLYYRSPRTSLQNTIDCFTLGERLTGPDVRSAVEKLERLWNLLFATDRRDQQLPYSQHRTAGMMFSYECRPRERLPRPMVHIPVKHFCQSDMHIALALEDFFEEQGWDHLARNYLQMVSKIFPNQDFHSTIGRHSYIGLSYSAPIGLRLTTYYNTMVFSTGEERNQRGRLLGPAIKRQRHEQ